MAEEELREENRRVKEQLDTLLRQARSNEEKMRRLQAQELRLLEMDDLLGLLQALLDDYRAEFNLDSVSLVIIDPEYEFQRLLDAVGGFSHPGLKLLHDAHALYEYYGQHPAIEMGKFISECHQPWFPPQQETLKCIAMLPLERRSQLMGSLNLASSEESRFSQEHGSDLLDRLASIVSISLENILNQERLKRIGLTDALTGLNNRRFFNQRLDEEIMRALRHDTPLSALFIDADYFKSVNDQYGHAVGDLALIELSKKLRGYVRFQDVLARFGGEEFAILLNGSELPAAVRVAERIREEIADMMIPLDSGHLLTLTVSIGVSEVHRVASQPGDVPQIGEALLQHADEALYAAKHQGRNRVMMMDVNGEIRAVIPDTGIKPASEQPKA
ncbi:MAG: sensor domain-containing diguanylate cyclase [Gammaproteobacteria bacterium]|nr:sensor domain-containing diguanylate cyclase [Gammaproteobacteria bacterium]